MQDYETEEQQIEALKKWWNENATSLAIGLGLGVVVLFGGREYLQMRSEHSATAGDLYFMVADQVNKRNEDGLLETTARLTGEYADTPYAGLAALLVARYEFEQGKPEESISQLQWVIDKSDDDELKHVARLRLSRIYLDQDNYDAADALLNTKHPSAFDAAYDELKGDYYVAKGMIDAARNAYDSAISTLGEEASNWLRLKRQDLGNAELDSTATVEPPA